MAATTQPTLHLQGRRLLLARLTWLFLAVLSFAVAARALPIQTRPEAFTCPDATCFPPALNPADQASLAEMGLSLRAYAGYFTIVETIPTLLAFLLVGVIIFWRKSDDWIAIITSTFLMTFITALGSGNLFEDPTWRWATIILRIVGPTLFGIVFFIFPDGRFVPRWTRWFGLAMVLWGLSFSLALVLPSDLYNRFTSLVYFGCVLVAFGAQVYRYRKVSTPIQRQQTKWILMAGFMMPFSDLFIRGVVLPAVLPWANQPGATRIIYNMVTIPIFRAVPFFLLPVSFAIAILRYRLWDIDVLIRRTLVYTILTGALAAVYISIVLLLQEGVRTFLGSPTNPVVIVVSTLAVAALFNPLRQRIQTFIDRRFYRQKYNAEQVLEAFGTRLRDEVDLDLLAGSILGVVQATMQPARLGIWMKTAENPRISANQHE